MSAKFTYADPAGAWTEDLGTDTVRLGSVDGYSMNADIGSADGSRLSFDDPSGIVGHSSDAIVGLKYLFVDEQAETAGNQRIFASLIGARDYTHAVAADDSLRLGVSRHIEAELRHINAVLSLDLVTGTDGNRTAEPVGTRMNWILNSSYLSGYVSTATTYVALTTGAGPSMDANDYRPNGTPLQVIEDCCLAVGYTAFLIWADETTSTPLLYFDDFKTSTAYSTAYRLSNVLSDIDSYPDGTVGATKTYSFTNTKLHRDPSEVASKLVLPYRAGWTVQTNSTTQTAFTRRGLVAPTQTVKTLSTATNLAQRLLTDHASEADTLSGDVELPQTHVNAIRVGHRISVKDSHAPGYSGFTWWRVVSCVPKQTQLTDQTYLVSLTLTPLIPVITCDDPGNVDLNFAHGTVTGYGSGVIGPHTVFAAPTNPTNMNDGNDFTTSQSTNSSIEPQFDGPYYVGWHSDLAAAYQVACMDYYSGSDVIGVSPIPDLIEYSTNDSTWTTVSYTSFANTPALGFTRWVFASSVTARYWRILKTITNQHNLPYGFGYWPGITGSTWRINGQ